MGARLSQTLFEESPPYAETLTGLRGSEASVQYVDENKSSFRVRATLRKLTSNKETGDGQLGGMDGTGGGGFPATLSTNTSGLAVSGGATQTDENAMVREFQWQEKVYGAHEVQALRESYPPNHVSHHGKKFLALSAENVKQIQQGIASGKLAAGEVLFTKVAADEFPNIRTKTLEEHKLLDLLFKRGPAAGQKLPKLSTALGYQPPQAMYIMAALEENEKRYEVELACLAALPESGALEITPRLYEAPSDRQSKKTKELNLAPEPGDSRIVFSLPGGTRYEFVLELAGKPPDPDSKKKALQRIQEIDMKAVALRKNLAGHGFEGFALDQDEDEVVSVFAEILSFEPKKAHPDEDYVIRSVNPLSVPLDVDLWEERCLLKSCQQFSSSQDCYYVMYEFHESKQFKFKYRSDESLSTGGHAGKRACTIWSSIGSTETAAIFNHGLECHFGRKKVGEKDIMAPVPLRLLLQVYKKDSWDRHQFLGYSYVDIPDRSGEYDISAKMWAPCGTIRDQLTNYFCGAAPTLLSPQYIVNTDGDQNPLNRANLKTTTMDGNVRILLHVVRQTEPKTATKRPRRNFGSRTGGRSRPGRRTGGAGGSASEAGTSVAGASTNYFRPSGAGG
ncbi:unnamed protein product [Amoebophrya sp. A120]|nr:unnamed protein product [Amoebophrya sp. A120]|eukprot:GSA120T00006097001.1